MKLDREQHWNFLNDELRAEVEEFNKKFTSKALHLLKESEEMFVAQYLGVKDGAMLVRFPNTKAIPRKGEFLTCMVLPEKLRDFNNWGNLTYEDLYKQRYKSTECVAMWQSKSDDPRFTLAGFHRVDVEFLRTIADAKGIILVFAPQMPPTEYITNMQKIVECNDENVTGLLDADYTSRPYSPVLIRDTNASTFLLNQLGLSNNLILQGPPGTGKTQLLAEVCAELCSDGKSVLVTALTNRALMELAGKNALKNMLKDGNVFKTNLSSDELHELKDLQPIKQILPIKGALILSTFFICSSYCANNIGFQSFDYVIMDEASQSLTAMFAAISKIGERQIWVGDTKQLPPIVKLNWDIVESRKYIRYINGLEFFVDNSDIPTFQLTKTFRLGKRAANYTGLFYDNTLQSAKKNFVPIKTPLSNILHYEGGPTLITTDMPVDEKIPMFAISLAAHVVKELLSEHKDLEIAVLTCFVKTTKTLQKTIANVVGNTNNMIVDTIARVQGLTTDVTVYVIPNSTYFFALDPHLFNVATSRAKEHTIIIADNNILNYWGMDVCVRNYIEKLSQEKKVYIPSESNLNLIGSVSK